MNQSDQTCATNLMHPEPSPLFNVSALAAGLINGYAQKKTVVSWSPYSLPFHSHQPRRFNAKRIFTNREEPLALVKRAISTPQLRDEHRVISWYGVGGQGKSRLCREITSQFLAQPGIAHASLDFELVDNRSLEQAMLTMRSKLGRNKRLAFPTFDLAFTQLFNMRRPGENIRLVYPQLFKKGESELLDDLIDWCDTAASIATEGASAVVPGVNLIYKYSARFTGRLADWWNTRGAKESVREISELSAGELAAKLPKFFGFDLYCAQERHDCPRLVLTLDTFEKLWGGESARGSGESMAVDHWVRNLVSECPGVLFLFFGRDKLRWSELDPRWADILDQHLLGGLSASDADRFLAAIPIKDPMIRKTIISAAQGLPYYLDLAVDQFTAIMERGEAPSRDSFGGQPSHITERFLSHLGEEERRDLVMASYVGKLNEDLFNLLLEKFYGGKALGDWARLKRRSVMRLDEDGSLKMHALMLSALQQKERSERPMLFQEIHRFLFEHFDNLAVVTKVNAITPENENALLNVAKHCFLKSDDTIGWVEERTKFYRSGARFNLLEEFTKILIEGRESDPMIHGFLNTLLAGQVDNLGRLNEAEELFLTAIAHLEGIEAVKHTHLASALSGLAVTLDHQGRYREAEEFHQKSLALKTESPSPNGFAVRTSLGNLAGNFDAQGKYELAEHMYRFVIGIEEERLDPKDLTLANRYNNLAVNLSNQGKDAEAETLNRKSLNIKTEMLEESHPSIANSYCNLGNSLRSQKRYKEAEAAYRKALSINEMCFGLQNPELIVSYSNLATSLSGQERYEEADVFFRNAIELTESETGQGRAMLATLYSNYAMNLSKLKRSAEAETQIQIAITLTELSVGAHHPEMAVRYSNFATIFDERESYQTAETWHRQALRVANEALSFDHPDITTHMNNLAANLDKQERYKEAEELYREVLEIRQKHLQLGHGDVALSHAKLANNYRLQGRFDDAETGFRTAIAGFEHCRSHNHAELASSYSLLARTIEQEGRYEEAEKLHQKALSITQDQSRPNKKLVALYTGDLARNLEKQSRFEEAENWYHDWVTKAEELYPSGHENLFLIYAGLGETLDKIGKHESASEYLNQAKMICKTAGPEARQNLPTLMSALATNLRNLDRTAEAEEEFREALRFLEETNPRNNCHIAIMKSNLAGCLDEIGCHYEAEQYRRAAVEFELGSESPNLAFLTFYLSGLARSLLGQGKEDDARRTFVKCTAQMSQLSEDAQIWIGHSLLNWAIALSRSQYIDEARIVAREALMILSSKLPPANSSVIKAQKILD